MLLFLNLKSLIKKTPLHFAMIALVLFFTVTGTILVYNYYLASKQEDEFWREGERTYSVSGPFVDIDKALDELVQKHGAQIQRVYAVSENGGDRVVSTFYGEPPLLFKVQLGRYFDARDAAQALVPSTLRGGAGRLIGGSYSFHGTEYAVIGVSSIDAYEIPYRALAGREHIGMVAVVSAQGLKDSQKKLLADGIKSIFPENPIAGPSAAVKQPISPDYIMIYLVLLLGALNLSYILVSLMEKRKRQQAILHILGYGAGRLVVLYMAELFVPVTAVFAFSAVFCRFAVLGILNRLDVFYYHVIGLRQYAALYALYAGLVMAVLLHRMLAFFRKTGFEIKRR